MTENEMALMLASVAVGNPLCPIGQEEMVNKVANGTPLPKGHGRLIDADELQDYFEDNRSKLFHSKDCIIGIDNTPTIIKADKLCGAKMESEESDEVSN